MKFGFFSPPPPQFFFCIEIFFRKSHQQLVIDYLCNMSIGWYKISSIHVGQIFNLEFWCLIFFWNVVSDRNPIVLLYPKQMLILLCLNVNVYHRRLVETKTVRKKLFQLENHFFFRLVFFSLERNEFYFQVFHKCFCNIPSSHI